MVGPLAPGGNVATQNANGPAETAISPSHDSHPSQKGSNAMNDSSTTASAATRPTLAALIATHRDVFRAYQVACAAADDSRTPEAEAAFDAADAVEQVARYAILAHRPETVTEASDKLCYLWGSEGPWHGLNPDGDELAVLLASMNGSGAAVSLDAELLRLGGELVVAWKHELDVFDLTREDFSDEAQERDNAASEVRLAVVRKIDAIQAVTVAGLGIKALAFTSSEHEWPSDDPSVDLHVADRIKAQVRREVRRVA